MTKIFSPEEFKVQTEVFSRVVGYIRPVNQWNEGKQEEFRQRKLYDGNSTNRQVPDMQETIHGRGPPSVVNE